MHRTRLTIAAFALALTVAPAVADDLTGSDVFLCATGQAVVCVVDEDCEWGSGFLFNIPEFIEIDLKAKLLRTTKASRNPRETPITSLQRAGGLVLIQGSEKGRAYSFVINEQTGEITAAVAREGVAVGVFGACTPSSNAAPVAQR